MGEAVSIRRKQSDQVDWLGRGMFLFALRRRWPGFWRSLNHLWHSRDPLSLQPWLAAHHVRDEWLVEVIGETLEAWSRDPDGLNARLHEDHPWYYWSCGNGSSDVPEFQPIFTQPWPLNKRRKPTTTDLHNADTPTLVQMAKEIEVESLKEFEARIRGEFALQIRDYIRKIKTAYYPDTRPELLKHADWTALFLAGHSAQEIAQDSPGLRSNINVEFPEKTVRKGIKDFAASIGLTLPKTRKSQ